MQALNQLNIQSPEVLTALLIGFAVSLIIVLFLQIRNSQQINKITYPAYEFTIKKAQSEADAILEEARNTAREIVAKAELESSSFLEARKESVERGREDYARALSELEKGAQTNLSNMVLETEEKTREMSSKLIKHLEERDGEVGVKIDEFVAGLSKIPNEIKNESVSVIALLNKKVEEAGEEVRASLMQAHENNNAQIRSFLEEKFVEAQKDIDAYREGKKALVDRNIESIVKDVTRITLGIELDHADHAHLARKALEKVKAGQLL